MLARLVKRAFGSSSAATMSGQVPNPPPTYVYKILETAKTNPIYLFPVPVPAWVPIVITMTTSDGLATIPTSSSSHRFRDTPLDEKDGFVHMSTAKQVPDTLKRFFADHDEVVLLRMDYKRLSSWKDVRWESTSSGQTFPHLYGYGIEGEMLDSFKEVKRGQDGEKLAGWDEALAQLERDGWLAY